MADPGQGINLTNEIKLEPHLGVNLQIDSNPWLLNETERAQAVAGGGYVVGETGGAPLPVVMVGGSLNPGLVLGASYDRVDAKLSYDHYFQTYFSAREFRRPLSYANNFNGRLFADIFPKGMFGLTVRDQIRQRSSTSQTSLGAYVDSSDGTDGGTLAAIDLGGVLNERFTNDMGLKARYSPGAALDFYLGGSWAFDRTVGFQGESYDQILGSKNGFGVDASGRWKFFPRTYLLAETDYTTTNYAEPDTRGGLGLWSARAGVVGQFTASLQAVGLIGYGQLNNRVEDADDLKGAGGIIGHGTLNWTPQKTQSLNLSFVRNFADNLIADYYINNTLSFGYSGLIYDDRLETNAGMGIDFRRLDLTNTQSNAALPDPNTRHDQRYRFRASVGYRFAPWLRGNVSYQLSVLNSDDTVIQYTRHLVTIGVRGQY